MTTCQRRRRLPQGPQRTTGAYRRHTHAAWRSTSKSSARTRKQSSGRVRLTKRPERPANPARWRASGELRAKEWSVRLSRLVGEKEAATALGLELATFRSWVASGKLPKPIAECSKYDLKAIDAALGRISGLGGPTNALDAWKAKRTTRNARTP